MYFSSLSTATATILFAAGLTQRRAEDQVQRHAEDGEDDPGGQEREGGASRQVTAAPQRAQQEAKRAQDHQPVRRSTTPGQLGGEHPTQAGQIHQGDQGAGRQQRMLSGSVKQTHPSLAAIRPPPITLPPSQKT